MPSPRAAILVLLLALPAGASGAPEPGAGSPSPSASAEVHALDPAKEALAEGDPRRAARILQAALPEIEATGDADAASRVRCLLGAAQLRAGSPAAAERTLAPVPLDAACGRRAGFLRAEAMAASERLDEAAALLEELGAVPLGDDRDGQSAEALAALARRLLADPDRGRDVGLPILAAALELRIGDDRAAALAREIAAQVMREPVRGAFGPRACDALVQALTEREDRADRLAAAAVCDSGRAATLLAAMPDDDPDGVWLRAAIAPSDDARDLLRERALAATTDPDTLAERRRALALDLAARGALRALPLLEADGGPDALRARARLLRGAGRPEEALAALTAHLDRFPADPHRAEVAALRAAVLLDLARAAAEPEAALAHYDALLARHPDSGVAPIAAYEAGVVARASGDGDGARRRWDELLARWPGTDGAVAAVDALARQRAFDGGDLEGARDLLRRRADQAGASTELDRLSDAALWIEAPGRSDPRRKPKVRLGARNLDTVELRIHRIDLEAFARAGGRLDALAELDVAAIAPDRTLPVDVPDASPGAEVAFEVEVPVGPGLYALTAASAEEEARALLLVSDLAVVARAVGTDLAVATFDAAGEPVGRARVLIAGPGGTIEGETDASGLWIGRVGAPGEVVVLAERRGSWALAELGVTGTRAEAVQVVDAELERPAVLPGDRLGVRAVARDATGEPLTGRWTVWVDGGDPVEADTDRYGILHVELDVPDTGRDAFHDAVPQHEVLQVLGIPPGNAEPTVLGTVARAPRDPGGRTLDGWIDGADAVFRVLGPHGEPVAGVFVASDDRVAQTDARGEVRFPGPPLGLPWRAVGRIVGGGGRHLVERQRPERRRASLAADRSHVRPGEAPRVTVRLVGPDERPRHGAVEVRVERWIPAVEPPAPRPDPWVPAPRTGLGGWIRWDGAAPTPALAALEPHWRATLDVDGTAVAEIPALPPGRWRVTAIPWDGAGATSTLDLVVSPAGLRLLGARDTGVGDTLALAPDGAAALLTAESDRLLWAAVQRDGRRAEVRVGPEWRGEVTLAATAPDGQVAVRTVSADPTLDVALVVEPDGDGKRLRAVVTDRAGRPVDAEVALTAWDLRLEAVTGPPGGLDDGFVRGTGEPAGAIGADLWSGAHGEAIAPALLAEAARERERQKARSATASGLLSDNALAEALLGEGVVGFGTIGTAGHGSGTGYGGIVGSGGGGVLLGASGTAGGTPGIRERVLWHVARTDARGAVSARLGGPAARYRVRATAVAGAVLGVTEIEVDLADRVWWVVHEPLPALPGDEATPTVTVVNGTAAPAPIALRLGDAEARASIAPGTARTLPVGGPLPAGTAPRPIELVRGDEVALRAVWRFPLREGPPDPDGPLTVWAVGPGGSPPLAEIALRPDPAAAFEPWRAAVAGRAALAALRFVDRADLRAEVDRVRGILRHASPATPTEAAQVLMFLAEARRAGFPVSQAAIDQAGVLGAPRSAAERGLVVLARLDAGLELDRNLVALVEQDAADPEAPPESVAALIALGRPAPARSSAAIVVAAARAMGRTPDPAAVRALRDAGPPLPGDPALPEWIAAVGEAAGRPRRAPEGRGEVRVTLGDGAEAPSGAWRWRARPPGDPEARHAAAATRIPPNGAARPIVRGAFEPAPCDPCRIAVGDWLAVDGVDPAQGPTGLDLQWIAPGVPILQARAPGRFTVAGLARDGEPARPVVVEVVPGAPLGDDVSPDVALAVARDAVDARRRLPLPELGPRWAAPLAGLAFRDALQGDDDARIAATFRALAATDPSAGVALAEVARAARAMRVTGDPAGAIRAWRAGLDAAFAAEAAGIGRVEDEAGLLVAVQRVREAALRYPDGPATGEALYLLPARLLAMADQGLPPEVQAAGITATDVRLTAAAWDREFLAYYPDHPRAVSAGLRLARILLTLGAPAPAASWAARVGAANPDAPLRDALLYLEALARSESGDTGEAERLLKRLLYAPFPGPDGVPAPSVHRADAQIVLGRLLEARGQVERALEAYAAAGESPEAERARLALQTPTLDAPPVVRLGMGEPAEIPLRASHVDVLRIRAYAVDLRTLFLRDGGLAAARDVAVAGVSPAWSGERHLRVGPFPTDRHVDLPLHGPGAWLVQLEGSAVVRSVLVVRSGMALAATDAGGGRRVAVRRAGVPAAGVEVRALTGGEVVPAVTDVRGVAEVPAGAAVLAWDGPHWAFTDPDPGTPPQSAPRATDPADERGLTPLLQQVDERALLRQSEDADLYEQRFRSATERVELNAL